MSSRLSSSEIKFYRKRLDETAKLSKQGVAVVMKEYEETGVRRPVLYYRNGMVWRRRARPCPLKELVGWEAHYVMARQWEPLDARSPLELLAEAAGGDEESIDEEDSGWI
jgi:hypothetical protein